MSTITVSLWALALTALAACIVSDVYKRIIPDKLLLVIAVLGVAIGLARMPGQVWISVCAAFALIIALGFLSRSNLIGGGDVKMIAAVSLLVPPGQIGALLIEVAVAGGLLSCAYLSAGLILRSCGDWQLSKAGGAEPSSWIEAEKARIVSLSPVPYGLAIAVSVFFYFLTEISP